MFKIYDGREHFYQWDIDRKLIVAAAAIKEVHFCNRTGDCSLVCETYVEDGLTLVNVPNILLQTDWKIHVYAYDGYYTKHDDCFDVVSRSKPADYVYTETEVLNYTEILERLEELEKNGGASIEVDEYLDPQSTNPIQNKAVYGAWEDLLNNKVSYAYLTPIEETVNKNASDIQKLENSKASNSHRHAMKDIYDLVIDDTLSDTSANPVQNKTIAEVVWALEDIVVTHEEEQIPELYQKIGDIETATSNIIALQNAYIGGENA